MRVWLWRIGLNNPYLEEIPRESSTFPNVTLQSKPSSLNVCHYFYIFKQMPRCRKCTLEYDTYPELKGHLQQSHDSDLTYQCRKCDYESEEEDHLVRHLKRQHQLKGTETKQNRYDIASIRFLRKRDASESPKTPQYVCLLIVCMFVVCMFVVLCHVWCSVRNMFHDFWSYIYVVEEDDNFRIRKYYR